MCALIATYAALTSDAERTASAPPAGSATPVTAAPDTRRRSARGRRHARRDGPRRHRPRPRRPDAADPDPEPVAGRDEHPRDAAGDTAAARTAARGTPPAVQPPAVQPPAGRRDEQRHGHGHRHRHGQAAAATEAVTIEFRKDAAQTYDPIKRAGAEFGPAEDAIDDKPDTVWDVTVPADGQPIDAGLVIDLGKPYALRSLRLDTPTDGFTLEVYGAKSAKELPEDVIDKRWIHLTDKKFVLDDEPILLKGKGGGVKVQLILLHIKQAADPDDPHVAIGNVTLRGTP